MAPPIGQRPIRVALGAGHRHTLDINGNRVEAGGANPYEFKLNGKKTPALARELRRRGHDVWSYTPMDGAGSFPGDYNDAAASVVARWHKTGWAPDIFIELHSEGSDPEKCGSFILYPDFDGDVDVDLRDGGGVFARMLNVRTGIKPCNILTTSLGVSSEKQSGVGLQGFRLGVFAATRELAPFCSRLIFEGGAHSCPHDKTIMDQPAFSELHALAVADALEAFARARLGWRDDEEVPTVPAPTEQPDTALVRRIETAPYLRAGDASVYRMVRLVALAKPCRRQQWADTGAPDVGDPATVVKTAGLILVRGQTWLLEQSGARVNVSGVGMTWGA